MRIGMFTDTYFPQVSGVSTSIELLKDQLIQLGHEVVIFTTTDPNAQETPGIVRLPSIPFASFEDRRIAYRGFDDCLAIAKEYNLDIIHTHTEFSLGLAGKYVASKMNIPTVHTYHTMYENYTHYIWNGMLIKRQHVKWYSKLFCSQTQGVIAPSRMTYQTLLDYGVKVPIQIIPTGVKLPKFDPNIRHELRQQMGLREDDLVLLSLSRISKEKSIDEIIEAFPKIKQSYSNAHLLIVGDGPQRASLEALVRGYGLEDVHFIGEIDHKEVFRYYQMADIYVNASESESQGLTYLEALANRLPMIAKHNEYLDMLVSKPSYGRLYTASDQLANTVIAFLNHRGRGMIQEINQEDLKQISVEVFADRILACYEEALQGNSKGTTTFFKYIAGAARNLFSIR